MNESGHHLTFKIAINILESVGTEIPTGWKDVGIVSFSELIVRLCNGSDYADNIGELLDVKEGLRNYNEIENENGSVKVSVDSIHIPDKYEYLDAILSLKGNQRESRSYIHAMSYNDSNIQNNNHKEEADKYYNISYPQARELFKRHITKRSLDYFVNMKNISSYKAKIDKIKSNIDDVESKIKNYKITSLSTDRERNEYDSLVLKNREYEKHIEETRDEIFRPLGIILHGFMDSLTPSHADWQCYSEQNLLYHAYGDEVYQYLDEKYSYSKETNFNDYRKYFFAKIKELSGGKGLDDNIMKSLLNYYSIVDKISDHKMQLFVAAPGLRVVNVLKNIWSMTKEELLDVAMNPVVGGTTMAYKLYNKVDETLKKLNDINQKIFDSKGIAPAYMIATTYLILIKIIEITKKIEKDDKQFCAMNEIGDINTLNSILGIWNEKYKKYIGEDDVKTIIDKNLYKDDETKQSSTEESQPQTKTTTISAHSIQEPINRTASNPPKQEEEKKSPKSTVSSSSNTPIKIDQLLRKKYPNLATSFNIVFNPATKCWSAKYWTNGRDIQYIFDKNGNVISELDIKMES